MLPPKPASRPDGAGLIARVRAFRRDMFASQPDRLYGAQMAELRTPLYASFLVNDPALVDLVLTGEPGNFPKSLILGDTLATLLGRSIFVTNGTEWARQRRLIDPAFAGGRLREAFPVMLAAGAAAVDRLRPLADGRPVEVEAETAHLAADVIFRSLFSLPITDRTAAEVFAEFRRYQRSAPLLSPLALLRAPRWLPRFPRRDTRAAGARIRALLAGLITARAGEIAAGTAPDDLATALMTSGPDGFSGDELLDQLAIFFLAGHETSASALAWALLMLALDPAAQARVAAEAGPVFADTPDFADLRRLPFTRDVLRETLRLYPPVPMLLREAAAEAQFRGRRVRRGALVILSPWHLQRHRRHWPEPDAFDPDRWAREENRGPARDAYLPFSAGPRVCPGAGFAMMEGTLLIARLVAAFRIAPVTDRPARPIAHLTVRSADGIWLGLTPRDG